MGILWKEEQDFKESLDRAINMVKYEKITIQELLDLGFNNNYLKLSNEKTFKLGYIDENREYSKELSKEQLNVKIYMKEDFGYYSDEDIDEDGYHIAKVYCINQEDEELFEEMI